MPVGNLTLSGTVTDGKLNPIPATYAQPGQSRDDNELQVESHWFTCSRRDGSV